jgi:hypothetical protein
MNIRLLDDADRGYALASWRESHKQSPGCDNVPWNFYKVTWGAMFTKLINDPSTVLLGAYTNVDEPRTGDEGDNLLGFLVMTPGKRVRTLHWVQVKYELNGVRMRRHGIMNDLLSAAELGTRCIYTLRARRDRRPLPDGTMTKSLAETLAVALRARGITPAFTSLKEWLS